MTEALSPTDALICLMFVLPVTVWVAWSDMKFMKIPNRAVGVLFVLFLGLGLILLPLQSWLWGIGLMAIVLAVGFVINLLKLVGAGDAKYAAAMAPFFVGADPGLVGGLFAACLLGAFVSHRTMKHIPPFRAATADWISWTVRDFPMGLALSGTLVFYLLAVMRLG